MKTKFLLVFYCMTNALIIYRKIDGGGHGTYMVIICEKVSFAKVLHSVLQDSDDRKTVVIIQVFNLNLDKRTSDIL